MRTLIALLALALLPLAVAAQTVPPSPNVTPQTVTGLQDYIEVDVRLKGIATATNPSPTIRVVGAARWEPMNGRYFTLDVPCWNKSSACPPVAGVTFQVFFRLTGSASRTNVTRFTGMCGLLTTECIAPWFVPITAKPGESYRFRYDRVAANWDATPTVVPTVAPPPVTPPAVASPDGTRMPPATELIDGEGAKWTTSPQTGGVASQVGCRRNGAAVNCNSVDFLTIKGGVIYQSDFGSGSGWSRWSGGVWVASPAP
jgi:hypothetical protein